LPNEKRKKSNGSNKQSKNGSYRVVKKKKPLQAIYLIRDYKGLTSRIHEELKKIRHQNKD
jgi:hypothetical protein